MRQHPIKEHLRNLTQRLRRGGDGLDELRFGLPDRLNESPYLPRRFLAPPFLSSRPPLLRLSKLSELGDRRRPPPPPLPSPFRGGRPALCGAPYIPFGPVQLRSPC